MNEVQRIAQLSSQLARTVSELADVVGVQESKIETLETQLADLRRDMMDVLKTTGIEFERWRTANRGTTLDFIKARVTYWRENGYGMQEAGKMAVQDLKDMHRSKSNQTQVTE